MMFVASPGLDPRSHHRDGLGQRQQYCGGGQIQYIAAPAHRIVNFAATGGGCAGARKVGYNQLQCPKIWRVYEALSLCLGYSAAEACEAVKEGCSVECIPFNPCTRTEEISEATPFIPSRSSAFHVPEEGLGIAPGIRTVLSQKSVRQVPVQLVQKMQIMQSETEGGLSVGGSAGEGLGGVVGVVAAAPVQGGGVRSVSPTSLRATPVPELSSFHSIEL